MNNLINYLGIIFVLAGVVCLLVYEIAVPSNGLLISSLALEFIGIISHIVINRQLQ